MGDWNFSTIGYYLFSEQRYEWRLATGVLCEEVLNQEDNW